MATTPRLRWRKQPNEKGLMAVGQGERGYDLWYGEKRVAHAGVLARGFSRDKLGYYWSCGTDESLGIVHENTANRPKSTIEEAKAEAFSYVKNAITTKLLEKIFAEKILDSGKYYWLRHTVENVWCVVYIGEDPDHNKYVWNLEGGPYPLSDFTTEYAENYEWAEVMPPASAFGVVENSDGELEKR